MTGFPVCLEGERLTFLTEYIAHDMLPGEVHISRSETPGNSWDGASIPRWAWSIMGHPLAADVREASYWHDRICEGSKTPEDRMVADAVFLMLLRRAGVSRWRRWAMWAAVRFYAVVIWRVRTMTERVCENCRWWENDQHAIGACMRKPPQRIAEPQYDEWPKTHATDRCGEWADASITPEQEDRQELTRRFAVAIMSTVYGVDLQFDLIWTAAKNMAAAEPQIQRENEQ